MNRLCGVLLAAWMAACGGGSSEVEEPAPRPAPLAQTPKKIVKEIPWEPGPAVEEGPGVEDDEGDPEEDGVDGVIGGSSSVGILGGPPPPNAPQIAPMPAVEARRIAGRRDLVPDDQVKLAMKNAGKDRVVAVVKLCLRSTGLPETVSVIKSSGYPTYDHLLTSTISSTWRYTPFRVDGNAVPVCTSVTFIYDQKDPE